MAKLINDFLADPEKKSTEKKEEAKSRLEGTLDVMPDCEYRSGQSYTLEGLGSVFDRKYQVKRVTHNINRGGYSVSLEMTADLASKGKASGGDRAPEEPRRENANTKAADETAYVSVEKETGSVSQ
jgi:hypothetical protein